MITRPQKIILIKLLSVVSVVRGYAIVLMIAAQLFTAAFILAPETPLSVVFFFLEPLVTYFGLCSIHSGRIHYQ